jgi:autotransporter-associated beta strand protein
VTAFRALTAAIALTAIAALPATAAAGPRTIVVTSISVKLVTHDTKPKGASRGDTVVYQDRLVNAKKQFGKKKGSKVGTDSGTLTFTGAHTATYSGKTNLPGGMLILSGGVYTLQNGDLLIPVTGGTGTFNGVTGTLIVGTGTNHVLNTYRLKAPRIA